MSKTNYSRAVREAAEKIPRSAIVSQPHIVHLQKVVDELEEKHQALVSRQRAVRARGAAIEARIEALKTEVAEKRAALPDIASHALASDDLDVTAAVKAREDLQRLMWEIEANTDALEYFRKKTLPQMQTVGEQSGTRVNDAVANLARVIEGTALDMASD